MKWPPNNAWTSASKRDGFRHFQVKKYGGLKEERWVELSPVVNKQSVIKVYWSELKSNQWKSGWLQLPQDEDCKSDI
tara:strand:- start:409 stop:639 length:231 start_codon:yes stop_codon:yes gene_type:complete